MSRFEARLESRSTMLCIAAAVISLGAACSTVPRSAIVPVLRLTGISWLESTGDSQRFRVSLVADNPNAYPIPLRGLEFTIRLAGEGLIESRTEQSLTLAAYGSETIEVDVNSDMVSSMSRLLAVAQGPDDAIGFTLNGSLILPGRPPRLMPFSGSGQVGLSATLGSP